MSRQLRPAAVQLVFISALAPIDVAESSVNGLCSWKKCMRFQQFGSVGIQRSSPVRTKSTSVQKPPITVQAAQVTVLCFFKGKIQIGARACQRIPNLRVCPITERRKGFFGIGQQNLRTLLLASMALAQTERRGQLAPKLCLHSSLWVPLEMLAHGLSSVHLRGQTGDG